MSPSHFHKLEQDRIYKHFIERTRLGFWHKVLLYSATSVLWLSGVVWVLLHYFGIHLGNGGQFGWSPEPLFMKIHGASAMGFLMILGSLLVVHIRRGWALKRNRFSGVFLVSVCAFLVFSGWILYYLAGERTRAVASLSHWIVGVSLPLIIYLHILAWRWEENRE